MMTIGFLYWLLLIIAAIFCGLPYFKAGGRPAFAAALPSLFVLVLFVLLGLAVFGQPIRG